MTKNLVEEPEILAHAAAGDEVALQQLFSMHHDRLQRMVQVRLNRRLWQRVDANDVLQEAYLEIAKRLPRYLEGTQDIPFFLWMRHVVAQKIIMVHRQHLGAKKRDAAREVTANAWGAPSATSASVAAQLVGKLTSPSQAIVKAETRRRVQQALDRMSELDREVLVMRHFEQLSNAEVAKALEIRPAAASSRYVRALDHLQSILGDEH